MPGDRPPEMPISITWTSKSRQALARAQDTLCDETAIAAQVFRPGLSALHDWTLRGLVASQVEFLPCLRYAGNMNLPDLETEALKLPAKDRARLAEALLESLDTLSEEENEALWVEEARRRNEELDHDLEAARSSDDVFRSAKARLG